MDPTLAPYRGRTIVVSGGAGAIGSNLVAALAPVADTVIVLDDLSSSHVWNIPTHPDVLFVEGSVTDEATLKRVFAERPSVVFHLAAFFANQRSVDYPERDLEVNGLGTLRLMQIAALARVDRFVYASSGCSVYGAQAPLPLDESFMSMHLTTPYQVTKMLGELYGNFFHHHHELPVVQARLFNSYGPGEVPGRYRNVIPNFIYWALSGQPLPLTGDPEATRDFTYVGDVVTGLLRCGVDERAIGAALNIASGVETRIADLAHRINHLAGNPAGTVEAQRRVWDTKSRLRASLDLAGRTIDYAPAMDFDTGLRNTIEWFREHWDEICDAADFPPGRSPAVRPISPPPS